MKNAKMMNRILCVCLLVLMIVTCVACGTGSEPVTNYTGAENWAFYAEGSGDADLFFICPTVDMGTNGNYNMSLDDEVTKANFVGATRMELGIYDANATVYVPYYRQVSFPVYSMTREQAEPYFLIAYADVKAAFEAYLKQCDESRPLILAGFSQGGGNGHSPVERFRQ